uniref:Uncharacterized protein LOC114914501 n=1 Tax=Elaeis guineensis var. tenera TaxID=51953 RepID=A0A8N4IAH9_ELAGV|nr:uncharacterized protein LOC114914501 [Elaeis guineensis]
MKHDKVATAFIIQNHDAQVIQAGGKLLSLISVSYAELMAVWLGVQATMLEHRTTNIWLEDDSSMVIRWFTDSHFHDQLHDPLIQDLQHWKLTTTSFNITHTYREGNQVADYLADLAYFGDFT